ncbi:MAG TPA: hypothetical protein DCS43_02730 [Verrucomicrobia bacterium]|nr:hypothetical protein [Verrucomicrobiota bacterium]
MKLFRISLVAVLLVCLVAFWAHVASPPPMGNPSPSINGVGTGGGSGSAAAGPSGKASGAVEAAHVSIPHGQDPGGSAGGWQIRAQDARGYVRERLVENTGKYTVHRIEERWQRTELPGAEDVLLERRTMVGDHVMVQLREGATEADLERAIRKHGFRLRTALRVPRGFLVAVDTPDAGSVPALLRALAGEPFIGIAEPDYLCTINDEAPAGQVSIAETRPDDARYSALWGMEKIGMPRVWDATTGTGGVAVAVFDTGIDVDHPDLVDNLWINPHEIDGNGTDDDNNGYVDDIHGWDFYHDVNDPTDLNSHGTHVSGTIGAVGNNTLGVVGVAWNVRIIPIKFFGYNVDGVLEGYVSDAASGMYYVISMAGRQGGQSPRIRVTNHSWGGTGFSQLLQDAFQLAQSQGILHIAAAGNGTGVERNNDLYPHYPSSFGVSNMVAVANTTAGDQLSASSYYGATAVDLGAPGENILSTLPGDIYGSKTGTSMASPHVAGAAALLFEMFPDLDWQDVRRLLLESVDVLPALNGLCVSGGRLNVYKAIALGPVQIWHEPLPNTMDGSAGFPVEVRVRPSLSFVDTNRVELLWNTTGDPDILTSVGMRYEGDDRFVAHIPAQPTGARVSYMIRVEMLSGHVATYPADASLHAFEITYPVTLYVAGYPAGIGAVSPGYGKSISPHGAGVSAIAPEFSASVDGRRWRCSGWEGAGSVPTVGYTNRVDFLIRDTSYLLWHWREQITLTQTSYPTGVLNAVAWHELGSTLNTLEAPERADINGVSHAFTGWEINGQRYPDAVSAARNPAVIPSIAEPQAAVARYLPVMQDSDADGLADWWEQFYFNRLNGAGDTDPDGDGFSNAQEFADGADPSSSESVPEGPVIAHVPLPPAVIVPSPWSIQAAITDRGTVASVTLAWQRNQGDWLQVPMTSAGDALYRGSISLPDLPGDQISYYIVASDSGLYATTSAVHQFTVTYPVLSYVPPSTSLSAVAGQNTTVSVHLTNAGNATAEWRTSDGMSEPVAPEPGAWTHSGARDQWHISTRQAFSPPYAWFCGSPSGGSYSGSMDASLYTPPVMLGGSPVLRFMHWAEMERDGSNGFENHYWDGAVVEISRDDGHTFESITPVGGYPYQITPNSASPFEGNRPCLGGTTGGWELVEFDLAAYAGEVVQVRFRFGTDAFVESRGWFLDDISFSWETPWLVAPASGSVPAGGTADVELRLKTATLAPGFYQTRWIAPCNAPLQPILTVPISVRVYAPPSMRLSAENPGQFVVTWKSQTGRVYHLSSGTRMQEVAEWRGLPGATNLPGVAGSMSYTGRIEQVPMRFYRIDEQAP